MYWEGSPLARLLQQRLLTLQLLEHQLMLQQELLVEQLMRAPELQSSRELLPALRLRRLLRWLVRPADRAAAPPARGEAAHFDEAVVPRPEAEPAIAAVASGQLIWPGEAVDRGTVERHP